jgi:hypothetical protein
MMRSCFALAGLAAIALLVGCGESFDPDEGVIVTGTLVRDGQPINNPRNAVGMGGVEVRLVGQGIQSSSFCEADGKFEIVDAGKGVPPGKYKLAVTVHDDGSGGPPAATAGSPPAAAPGAPPGGAPGAVAGMGPADKLGGKLSASNTPIEVDVPQSKLGDKHDLGTIDIGPHLK